MPSASGLRDVSRADQPMANMPTAKATWWSSGSCRSICWRDTPSRPSAQQQARCASSAQRHAGPWSRGPSSAWLVLAVAAPVRERRRAAAAGDRPARRSGTAGPGWSCRARATSSGASMGPARRPAASSATASRGRWRGAAVASCIACCSAMQWRRLRRKFGRGSSRCRGPGGDGRLQGRAHTLEVRPAYDCREHDHDRSPAPSGPAFQGRRAEVARSSQPVRPGASARPAARG